MRCLNTRTKSEAHELEIINLRSQQAMNNSDGVLHFDGECRTCYSSYWQHGLSVLSDEWKLKPAICDCGSL